MVLGDCNCIASLGYMSYMSWQWGRALKSAMNMSSDIFSIKLVLTIHDQYLATIKILVIIIIEIIIILRTEEIIDENGANTEELSTYKSVHCLWLFAKLKQMHDDIKISSICAWRQCWKLFFNEFIAFSYYKQFRYLPRSELKTSANVFFLILCKRCFWKSYFYAKCGLKIFSFAVYSIKLQADCGTAVWHLKFDTSFNGLSFPVVRSKCLLHSMSHERVQHTCLQMEWQGIQ